MDPGTAICEQNGYPKKQQKTSRRKIINLTKMVSNWGPRVPPKFNQIVIFSKLFAPRARNGPGVVPGSKKGRPRHPKDAKRLPKGCKKLWKRHPKGFHKASKCKYPVAFGLPATVPGTAVTYCSGDCIGNSIAYWIAYRIPNALANCIWMPCGSLLDVFFKTCCYLLEAFWHLLDASGDLFWTPGRLLAHFGPGVQKVAKKLQFGWTLVAPGVPNLRPFW